MKINDSILIVEDNYNFRKFLYALLVSWGFSVIESSGGEEAIKFFSDTPSAAAILDIQMSGIDGIKTAEQIRKQSKSVKLIMLTDYDEEILRKLAKEAGADNYLLKENLTELRSMLNEYLKL